MAALWLDNFNRANDNDIADGVNYETANGPMDLVSNQIVSGSLGSDAAVRVLGGITWPADQYVQARLVSPQADGVGSGHGVIARSSNAAGNTFYRLVGNASGFELVRFPAGTSIASGAGTTFANGDIIGMQWKGTAYTLTKNGATFASGTDANIASGNPGLGHSSTSSGASAIDDLEAGSLGDAGGARRSTRGGNKRQGGPRQFKASVGTTESPTSVFDNAPTNGYAKLSNGMGPGQGCFNVRGRRTRFVHSPRATEAPTFTGGGGGGVKYPQLERGHRGTSRGSSLGVG